MARVSQLFRLYRQKCAEPTMTDWTRREILKGSGLAISASAASKLLASRVLAQSAPEAAASGPEASRSSSSGGASPPPERLSLDFGWRFYFGPATDPRKHFV